MDNNYISSQISPGKKELLYLNIFWAGLVLYSLGGIIGASGTLNLAICQGFQVLGLISMIPKSVVLLKAKIDSKYLRIIFIMYLAWNVTIFFRGNGVSINYASIKEFLFGDIRNILIYFAPLVLLFPRNFFYYKRLFYVITLSGILFLILCVLLIKKLMVRGEDILSQSIIEGLFDLGIPAAFILLTYIYHSNKRILIAIASIATTLFFIIVRARRGLIFITSSLVFYAAISYFFQARRKFTIIYFLLLFSLFAMAYSSKINNIKDNKLVRFLYERGSEDTRSVVELYFYDDMKLNDWIIGRGVGGTFFCPECDVDQTNNNRPLIETGYLQLILRGGIISLGLLLLITMPAIIMGIFFSKNILSKAAGIWIFQFILNLYPQNSVSFNLSYLMVWICVGICYSSKIRQLSNNEIEILLLSEKNKI